MTRNRVAATLGAVLLLAGVGVYAVYDQVLRGDAAPVLTLPTAAASAGASGGASLVPPTLTAATSAGSWAITTGEAGYRVRERLASLPAESDAVGRTTNVTGRVNVTASGSSVQITGGTITVDTTSITSDKARRDGRQGDEGLQTNSFPTATLKISSPLDVPATAFKGTAVNVILHGDLTLHGVTRTVDIPGQLQISGDQVQVSGSLTFPLADYSIVAPNIGGFIVSIADKGALEFLVTFAKA